MPSPKVILASASPQRRRLLKQLGVKFRIVRADVEEISRVKTTPAAFVKENARLKAENVAGRLTSGIVIGADTIVYIGKKKIIGKPKTLKEAKRNLRVLFSQPRWVYTGVCLIDAATGRRLEDYEKTKVRMIPLTEKEMDRYYAKLDPYDKAGGFDIEGWGSAFIDRIEGCYSNVIGLPMAKLAQMLKKFGITIF